MKSHHENATLVAPHADLQPVIVRLERVSGHTAAGLLGHPQRVVGVQRGDMVDELLEIVRHSVMWLIVLVHDVAVVAGLGPGHLLPFLWPPPAFAIVIGPDCDQALKFIGCDRAVRSVLKNGAGAGNC